MPRWSVASRPSAAQTAGVQTTSPMPGIADSLEMITRPPRPGQGIEAENVARALLARVESTQGPRRPGSRRGPRSARPRGAPFVQGDGRGEDRDSPSGPSRSRRRCSALPIRELATSLINLGVQRTLAGDPAAARPLLERALAIREAAFGPDHLSVAGALQSLGRVADDASG